MKAKNLLLTTLFLLAFGLGSTYSQWVTYTCEVTPDQADPVWLKGSTTPGTDRPY